MPAPIACPGHGIRSSFNYKLQTYEKRNTVGLHIPITNFSGVKLGLALATPHLLVPIIPEESEASLRIHSLYPYLLPASKRGRTVHT